MKISSLRISVISLISLFATLAIVSMTSAKGAENGTAVTWPVRIPMVRLQNAVAVDAAIGRPIVNGITATQQITLNGKLYWSNSVVSGAKLTVTLQGVYTPTIVTSWWITGNETYTDTSTNIYLKAGVGNSAGVVGYLSGNGRKIYSLSGVGYDFWPLVGTQWWDSVQGKWLTTTVWSDPAFVSLPTLSAPPSVYKSFLPIVAVAKSHPCSASSSVVPFSWQVATGYGICAANAAPINGINPVASTASAYSWFYPGLMGPNAHYGTLYNDGNVYVSGTAGITLICQNCHGFEAVYGITGHGYQFWTSKQAWWYSTSGWVDDAVWSDFTQIAVK